MNTPPPPRLIDFHSHYYETSWQNVALSQASASLAHARPLLTDMRAQLDAMEQAGIDAKVLSAPPAMLAAQGAHISLDLMQRINDRFAGLVAAHPAQLLALATIDAFQGEGAAREVERVVQTLGIKGICIDCAHGDLYLDAPVAQPVLQTAARLDVTIFVHPVYPPGLTERLTRLMGSPGILVARGTENAASLLTLLHKGILDQLPTLRLVLPMIGAAVFLFAGREDRENGQQHTPLRELRRRLYVDIMGFDPAMIRFAVELLGAEHVLNGSDWPIMPISTRRQIEEALTAAGLTDKQQAAVLSGNVERLLVTQQEEVPRA
jgi:predicted TIM-barrel fold metal-dependent hydrolase